MEEDCIILLRDEGLRDGVLLGRIVGLERSPDTHVYIGESMDGPLEYILELVLIVNC